MTTPATPLSRPTSAPPPTDGRQTSQRRALAAALARDDSFRSAQQIHTALRHDGVRVSLATVYRNLTRLAEAGQVDVLLRDDGEATYRLGSTRHHHHLVCRSCGHSREIHDPSVERWTHDVAAAHGYVDASHRLTVLGLCPDCAPECRAPTPGTTSSGRPHPTAGS